MVDLSLYTPDHRAELERLLDSPDWRQLIESGRVAEVQAGRVEPGTTRDYIATVVDQLLELNESAVRQEIAAGCTERAELLERLGRWPANLEGRDPLLSFLGLTVTYDCNFDPRCVYCNQEWRERTVGPDDWRRVVAEATEHNGGSGPYIYITGGEPLNVEEELLGQDGLVAFASRRGAAVNINTNAFLITPEIALRLVESGLSKLHISLDTDDRQVQDHLWGGERLERVLEGIYHVQLARDLVGSPDPEIHTNCVLTRLNFDSLPRLFSFIVSKRKQLADRKQPLFSDLLPHVIPVGGDSNDELRLTEDQFRSFYDEIWPAISALWDAHQGELGVPEGERGTLFGYFSNPYLRVEHEGGLEAYAESSARGRYGELALARHCYVAPTQASVSPDGLQYRCGSHAVRRLRSTGDVHSGSLLDSIRRGADGRDDLPDPEECYGCALATLYINQSVETKLTERLDALLSGEAE